MKFKSTIRIQGIVLRFLPQDDDTLKFVIGWVHRRFSNGREVLERNEMVVTADASHFKRPRLNERMLIQGDLSFSPHDGYSMTARKVQLLNVLDCPLWAEATVAGYVTEVHFGDRVTSFTLGVQGYNTVQYLSLVAPTYKGRFLRRGLFLTAVGVPSGWVKTREGLTSTSLFIKEIKTDKK